jgi:hypothetical protein
MVQTQFTLEQISKAFGLRIIESVDLYTTVEVIEIDEWLRAYLKRNIPLAVAISTKKAKSEMVIAPILLELKTRFSDTVSLFSGVEFNMEPDRGVLGICDFLLSLSPQQLYISAPVLLILEGKNDNIKAGFAQCMAEMMAARKFNEKEGTGVSYVHGVVTNGNQWKFLLLHKQDMYIDRGDYYIDNPGRILAILSYIVENASAGREFVAFLPQDGRSR